VTTFDEYLTSETLASIRARSVGYLQAAGVKILNFAKDAVVVQVNEALNQALYNGLAIVSQLVRGYISLDTSTDPGDPDPYDPGNESLTPSPGFLSAKGRGDYGTTRIDKTFATGTVTITNGSGSALTFLPDTLTFVRSTVSAATGLPVTYRNAAAPSIYTNPDGSVTIAASGTLDIPIRAEIAGTDSNANPSTVTLQTYLGVGVTATNAASALGGDREQADKYRIRCRLAPSAISPHGPADAYRYIALSARKDDDGNIFYFQTADATTGLGIDSDGNIVTLPDAQGTSMGVTRVQVILDRTTRTVDVYFAAEAGDPGGTVVTDLENLFDAIYWPDCTTRSFNAASAHTIAVTYTVKVKSGPGVTSAGVQAAVSAALNAYFENVDIGGYDQTAGAGTLYADEVKAIIASAAGAYHTVMTLPSGDVSLSVGEVPVLGSVTATVTIV
jgi:hypothetical protein